MTRRVPARAHKSSAVDKSSHLKLTLTRVRAMAQPGSRLGRMRLLRAQARARQADLQEMKVVKASCLNFSACSAGE